LEVRGSRFVDEVNEEVVGVSRERRRSFEVVFKNHSVTAAERSDEWNVAISRKGIRGGGEGGNADEVLS
jgi:hypothetical protein